MRVALERAGVEPGDVKAVWSAKSGLTVADEAEAKAIERVLGDDVKVIAPKLKLGEPMGAGAVAVDRAGAEGLAGGRRGGEPAGAGAREQHCRSAGRTSRSSWRPMPDDQYDVAVVGAGLGGLSVAAVVARLGKRVLVVDPLDGPGGCAHAFTRNGYVFDPAVHFTVQGNKGQILDAYLEILGVGDKVEFMTLDHVYGADFPDGERLTIPASEEGFIEAHAERFPDEADGIRRFVELAFQVTRESQALSQRLSLGELGDAAKRFPALFKYRKVTVSDVLDEHLSDPKLKAMLGASWPYAGTPPSKLSFMFHTALLVSCLDGGPVYPRGGFQSLADAFAEVLSRHDGRLLLDTRVASIPVKDGRVTGVVLEDGTEIRAPIVVSNADAMQTFGELVGHEHLPDRFVRRLVRMTASPSAVVLFAATKKDLRESGLIHETFVHPDWDHDAIHDGVNAGKLGGMWLSLPTLQDPSLAPDGEDLAIFTSLMAYDIGEPWADARDRYQELMLDQVERLIPGFREQTTYVETADPTTFERYLSSHRGAIYGWENLVNQTVPKRLPQDPPLEGLYMAGHWVDPGTGSLRVIYSGMLTSLAILGFDGPPALFAALAEAGQ